MDEVMQSSGGVVDNLRAGIAVYEHEQKVFKRLLRKRGEFTSTEFDKWFNGREWRRPGRVRFYNPETFILGGGQDRWAEMLELLQIMAQLGDIHIVKRGKEFVYSAP